MTSAVAWFQSFYAEVRKTPNWATMESTVEGSEWHREANVAVHTDMCIQHYAKTTADHRTPRQQMLTLITLLFHDFGKPEAEETLERKDGSGSYHRYAGHEPKSANEFLSFMCEHVELREQFFKQGLSWVDVRKIKFMIEHHLPFGLKNPTKRENLKRAVIQTLGDDEECFYDQLWSDCNGRISDDHDVKKANVEAWIAEFRVQKASTMKVTKLDAPMMYVLVGPVGVGKSTWTQKLRTLNRGSQIEVISEDTYRQEFFLANADSTVIGAWMIKDLKTQYAQSWQFCFDNSSSYEKYARASRDASIASGKTLVLDRTNQTRKSRSPWIQAAKQAGYSVMSIEFFASESLSQARQKTRSDKTVPSNRVHQMYMAFEVPWLGVEVDSFDIVQCD